MRVSCGEKRWTGEEAIDWDERDCGWTTAGRLVRRGNGKQGAGVLGEIGVRVLGSNRDRKLWAERGEAREDDGNAHSRERYQRAARDRVFTGSKELLRVDWAWQAVRHRREVLLGGRPSGWPGRIGAVPGNGGCFPGREFSIRGEFQFAWG